MAWDGAPFSSLFLGIRFATRWSLTGTCAALSFQFPFPRDSLCDRDGSPLLSGSSRRFQFPFPRDSLCDKTVTIYNDDRSVVFQFPFPRDSLCDGDLKEAGELAFMHFQFPFPRDSLCDTRRKPSENCWSRPFSSLFLGIRFATRSDRPSPGAGMAFSSLFLGIRFATLPRLLLYRLA